jgi:hypothetical protein
MRTLGVLGARYQTVFDVQFNGISAADLTNNYLPSVSGAVTINGGLATFHDSTSERISYYPPFGVPAKLNLQTDTEFNLRFSITAKGGVGVLMSCLNAARNNGFYIFVNDTASILAFYGVGVNAIMSVPIPIGTFTTVKCVYKRSAKQLVVYVDGLLAGTLNVLNFDSITNEPRYVHLGVFSDTFTSQPLNGVIDYVLIRDKTG